MLALIQKGQIVYYPKESHWDYYMTILRIYKHKVLVRDCEGNIFTEPIINLIPKGKWETFYKK